MIQLPNERQANHRKWRRRPISWCLFWVCLTTFSASAGTDIWISHVTAAQGWQTSLEIFTGEDSEPGTFRFLRRSETDGLSADPVDLPLQSLTWSAIPAGLLQFEGSARVLSDRDLLVKVTYRYDSSPSLCQFLLSAAQDRQWVLPYPHEPWIEWAGLALVNSGEARTSVVLEAWKEGKKLQESQVSLTPGSRLVRLTQSLWGGLEPSGFDTVILRSDLPIPAPLAILGDRWQDRHLFFTGQTLPVNHRYQCLVNGTLIDGTERAPMADAAVLFRDDTIVAVSPRDRMTIPAGTDLIDAGGAFILPGFVNAHVHKAIQYDNLRQWAAAGVTTVRDVGAAEPVETVFRFREEVRRDPSCARLVAAGPLVTVPGGYPLVPNRFPALAVNSPTDAEEKIRRLIGQGADLIKITLEPGNNLPMLSAAEMQAIVEIAHHNQFPVTAHLTRAADYPRSLDAGVDQFEHIAVDTMSEELIERMVRKGVILIPTLTAMGNSSQVTDNFRRYLAAGGLAAVGNDSGYITGLELGMPISELLAMQRAGLSPLQVIRAATQLGARACRLDGILGTVEPGKQADLLLIGGDPLQDLRHLLDVRGVYHAGVAIRLLITKNSGTSSRRIL